VQGQLQGEALSVAVQTECAHCSQAMHLEIDSNLACRVDEKDAKPIVFVPEVKPYSLTDPSIIDAL
jgi:hypothetical protein